MFFHTNIRGIKAEKGLDEKGAGHLLETSTLGEIGYAGSNYKEKNPLKSGDIM